jgi:hypothetical protein
MYSNTQPSHAGRFPLIYDTSAPSINNDSYETSQHGSDRTSHSSISNLSGHSRSPTLDFQVQLQPEDSEGYNSASYTSPDTLSDRWDSDGRCDSQESEPPHIPSIALPPDFDIEEALKLNTAEALYDVFRAKGLEVDGSGPRWTLRCPDCKDWCQTSIPSGLMLWHEGQFSSLASHRGSKRCVQAATRQRNEQSRTDDVRLLSRSHSLITAFSPSQSLVLSDHRYVFDFISALIHLHHTYCYSIIFKLSFSPPSLRQLSWNRGRLARRPTTFPNAFPLGSVSQRTRRFTLHH